MSEEIVSAVTGRKKTGVVGWSSIFATWAAVAGAGWGGFEYLSKYEKEIKRSEDSHVVQTFALYDSFNRAEMLQIREKLFRLPGSAFEVAPDAEEATAGAAPAISASATSQSAADPESEVFTSGDLFVFVDFFDAVQVCVERALCNADLVDRLLKPYADFDFLKARINEVREGEKENNSRHVFGEGLEWIANVDLQACSKAREKDAEAPCAPPPAAAPAPQS